MRCFFFLQTLRPRVTVGGKPQLEITYCFLRNVRGDILLHTGKACLFLLFRKVRGDTCARHVGMWIEFAFCILGSLTATFWARGGRSHRLSHLKPPVQPILRGLWGSPQNPDHAWILQAHLMASSPQKRRPARVQRQKKSHQAQDKKQIPKCLTAIGLDLATLTFWEIKVFSTKPPKS